MLSTLNILSRDQGKLFDHSANEDAYFTCFATRLTFALPKGPTALDVPQCWVFPKPIATSLVARLLRGTRRTKPQPDLAK